MTTANNNNPTIAPHRDNGGRETAAKPTELAGSAVVTHPPLSRCGAMAGQGAAEGEAGSDLSAIVRHGRQREGSFTLIETVIALAIIAFLIVETATIQGNAIVFSEYGRNVTRATWLAKRVMSKVEYHWMTSKTFKDMEANVPSKNFEDFPDYSYTLETKEWKFPFLQLLQGAMGGGSGSASDEEAASGSAGGMGDMLETVIKQIFGDEPIFMTAHVEVAWAEGAQQNSTGLTLLLTNQTKLDQAIVALKPAYDNLMKKTPATPAGSGSASGSGSVPAPATQPQTVDQ